MPTSCEVVAKLPGDVDLHARPAADFVRAAMRFDSAITVALGEREANAKSLLSVLALGAKRGSALLLRADGEDATSAVDALADRIATLEDL
jgi:phosphocarrier protein HPr